MSEFTSIASIGAAFAAGVLSFLSPCVMPLMPAYLSLISGISVEEMRDGCGDEGLRRRILLACLGFCTGFTTVFVLLGASAFAMGALVRTWRAEIFGIEFGMAQIAGLVVVVLGLHMAGLLPIRALYRDRHIDVTVQRVSWLRTFVVGAAFAFAWSPCVGPILGGIYTIAASRDTVFQGMAPSRPPALPKARAGIRVASRRDRPDVVLQPVHGFERLLRVPRAVHRGRRGGATLRGVVAEARRRALRWSGMAALALVLGPLGCSGDPDPAAADAAGPSAQSGAASDAKPAPDSISGRPGVPPASFRFPC
jgi:cytochrome c-type biogenesis protein